MTGTSQRTLRPLSAACAPREASRPGPLRLLQAFVLVGGLTALGWRVQHPGGEVRLQVELAAPSSAAAAKVRRTSAPRVSATAAHRVGPAARPVTRAVRAPGAPPSPVRHRVTRPGSLAPHTPRVPVVRALPVARAVAPVPPRGALNSGLPPVSAAGDAARRAYAPNPTGQIRAWPSISVAVIREELRRWHSPLLQATWADGKDAAQYIWDTGRVLRVDPAVVMAFFWHESHYGTRGMARLTDSVGNIRPLDGQPELNGYRYYRSWEEGVDDTYRLLRGYARGGAGDVATAVPVWAPSTDNNDVQAYVGDVQATIARYFVLSSATQMARRGGAELAVAVR